MADSTLKTYQKKINKDGSMDPKLVLKILDRLKSERGNWENLWQECADYFLPNKNNITVQRSSGEKRNLVLLDNTGIMSLVLLAGFIHGAMTNSSAKWFDFTTGDADLDARDDIRLYFEKCVKAILNVMNNSNFHSEAHEFQLDLACFGTATMEVEEDKDSVVRFFTRFIKEVFIKEDAFGRVSEVYRSFFATAEELGDLFGYENLPEEVAKCLGASEEKKFEVVHALYPKKKQNPGVLKYISQYIVKIPGKTEPWEARKKGFRDMPTAVSRWEKGSGETYGRSPAMNALPDMKTLNKMTETVLKGAEKAVDPPVQAPDDGFVMPLETLPASVNYYRAGSPDRIEPIFNDTRVDFGFEAIQDRRTRIRESFFVDQLKLREADRMTATEVNTRKEDSSVLMAPVISRQDTEFLSVVLGRVFDICERKGLLPSTPEILVDKRVSVKFSSMLAKTQRLSDLQGIFRTMEAIAPFASFAPEVTDNFDSDMATRYIAKGFGFPQEIIRDTDKRDAIREARAEAQAQAEAQQAQLAQAETVNKVAGGLAALNKTNAV